MTFFIVNRFFLFTGVPACGGRAFGLYYAAFAKAKAARYRLNR
jgi:hypothetical protein